MGRSNFERLFGKYVGVTPGEYISDGASTTRFQLLRTTDKTVLDIALESGYHNTANFNKQFKACNRSYSRKLSKQAVNEVFTLSMNTSFLYSFYIFIWLHNLDMA